MKYILLAFIFQFSSLLIAQKIQVYAFQESSEFFWFINEEGLNGPHYRTSLSFKNFGLAIGVIISRKVQIKAGYRNLWYCPECIGRKLLSNTLTNGNNAALVASDFQQVFLGAKFKYLQQDTKSLSLELDLLGRRGKETYSGIDVFGDSQFRVNGGQEFGIRVQSGG